MRRPARTLACLAGLAVAAGLLATGPAEAHAAARTTATVVTPKAASDKGVINLGRPSPLSLVQANIETGMSAAKTNADVDTVLAMAPDFVTLNEAHLRPDSVFAKDGYAIWRDHTNRYTAETPVMWRTDRWTPIAQGCWMISDHRGVPPHRQTELGRRYANWVTLAGVDGRVVSVVSVHIAPGGIKGMPDLIRPSTERLGMLTDQLSASGPVLLGGDFNQQYNGAKYPRDILDAHELVPTYDHLQASFPTGDHVGATIDYVMARNLDQFVSEQQYPTELNSDHDAVYGGYTWLTDMPEQTRTVLSNPADTTKRQVVATLASGVRRAEPGALLRIATSSLDSPQLFRDLKVALGRGVDVQYIKVGGAPTTKERKLQRLLATDGSTWTRYLTCVQTCRRAWRTWKVAALMMVSNTNHAWTERYTVNRTLTGALLTKPSKVELTVGRYGLDEGQRIFTSII